MNKICFRSSKLKYWIYCISLLIFHETLYSLDKYRIGVSQRYNNGSSNSGNKGGSYTNNNWQPAKSNQKTEKENEEFDNFPFLKSQSPIEKDKVAGIRIKGNNIVLLGYEKTFSIETLKSEEDFSNINFFRQYPRLFSVEINGITLSNQALENLQKFLPRDLKNFIVDSCILEKDGAELVADIIRKHNSLKAVTVKLIKSTPEEASKITVAISTLSDLDYLSVAFGEINQDSCDHITTTIKNSSKLKNLFIAWNKVIDKEEASYNQLSETISELKQMNSLDISILSISEKCTEAIIKSIAKITTLTSLKLYFGNLSLQNHVKLFETAEVLGDAIKHLTELKSLNISSMLLPKDAMQVVAQSISALKKLEYLNLSGNIIDKESSAIFSDSFKELDYLKTLIIRDCQIDSQTFSELARSLSSLPITTFCAGNNQIKDGVKNLPIKAMLDLRFVDFANNDVTFDTIMELLPETIDHEKIQVLDFKNNKALHEADNNGDIDSKRDKIEDWKLRNKSKIAIFGL